MGDETCPAFEAGEDYYNNGDGQYFKTIPTYTASESDTYAEYTNYFGNANFFDAFGDSGTNSAPAGDCVGYEEVVKKGL